MIRISLLSIFAALGFAAEACAQVSPSFRWQTGQVLTYRVQQATQAVDTVGESKVETSTRLANVKRWHVLEVDGAGVATLQLTLTALRIETTTPKGEVLTFDSTNPDKSDPQMKEQLVKYVGQPLAVLRVDAQGRVLEVKESRFGPASRYENELPFGCVLPKETVQNGSAWERAYKMTLEPPQGTGEKYDAVQKYACKSATAETITVGFVTETKSLPESLLDRVPLLQLQPEGDVTFDLSRGCVRSIQTRIDKQIVGHQGEGSSYRFAGNYLEELVEQK